MMLFGGLALLISAVSICTAKPINIEVEANWNRSPFQLDVIESIASENATAYYPLLAAYIGINELKGNMDDKTAYETLVQRAIEADLVSKDAVPYIDWKLALHEPSALIQAYYQYYETNIEPKLSEECENVLYYGGEYICDVDSVFALKTVTGDDIVEILPTDRLFGSNVYAPVAILYADLASETFATFHSHLVASAMSGKIQYIVRYKPSEEISEKERLSGYSVELALKRTDYLVIDDRNKEARETPEEEDMENIEGQGAAKPIKNLQVKQDAPISTKDLSSLGYKAAGYIINNEGDKFEALANVSLDFPKYSYAISQLPPDGLVFQDVKANSLAGIFRPGYNSLLINGAPIMPLEGDIYKVSEAVERERALAEGLAREFGISKSKSHELIANNYVGEASGIDHAIRYDYRNLGLIWLNDVDRDPQFKGFPNDVQLFLKEVSGEFHPIRHNANSIVMAVDLSDRSHLNVLAQAWSIVSRGLPVQMGIIPLTNTKEAKARAKELHYLEQNKSFTAVSMYLAQLMKQEKDAFVLALGATKKPDVDKDLDLEVISQDTQAWSQRFDIGNHEAVLFVNGVIVDPSVQWLSQASLIMSEDKKSFQKFVSDQSIVVDSSTPLRDHLLTGALTSRNRDITPPDEDSIRYMDTTPLVNAFTGVPNVTINEDKDNDMMTWWYFGDFADELPLSHTLELAKYISTCDEALQLNIVPIVDSQKKDTTTRQSRRMAIVNALQFVNHFKGKDSGAKARALVKVVESLYDKHYGSQTAELGSAMQRRTSLSAQLEPEFDHNDNLSVEYSDKLGEYWGLQVGSKLIAAGRIVKLTRPAQSSDFAALHLAEAARVASVFEGFKSTGLEPSFAVLDKFVTKYTKTFHMDSEDGFFVTATPRILTTDWAGDHSTIITGEKEENAELRVTAVIDPLSEKGQFYITVLQALKELPGVHIKVYLAPNHGLKEMPLKRFYRSCFPMHPEFDSDGKRANERVVYDDLNPETLYNVEVHSPSAWIVTPEISKYDLENIVLRDVQDESLDAVYELRSILIEGHGRDITLNRPPQGLALELGTNTEPRKTDTIVMANLGYMQFQANPGLWQLNIKEGRSSDIFDLMSAGVSGFEATDESGSNRIWLSSLNGKTIFPRFKRKKGMERANVLAEEESGPSFFKRLKSGKAKKQKKKEHAEINIFSVASGHLYERFLSIMTASVMKHTNHTVKFWLIEQFLSPSFREFLPALAKEYGFEYELVTYKWPHWLRGQSEKQRTIWGYKILFLDVLFPQSLENVIFVDADQIVRTDLKELVDIDLHGAPYGYTPMGDSREEMEGFRFWKQGYWKNFLEDGKYQYHISALYVVDLDRFRQMGAGDRLRQHYQGLSADPNSLANLDQDLPNNLQKELPIFSLPQEWLWCETWSADEELKTARTIDLCNNPLTKEPKLDRARRQLPEWTVYDNEIAELHKRFDEDRAAFQLQQPREQKVLKKLQKPEVAVDHDEL
ncbi:hypothetical protein TRVA0_008S02234 [Trichomonascus vanleenenianus]|uniref:Kre5p n=1 Tax=Trichomonascus vanleenenianus TaxID=2268995 RepID=UPI003ECB4504